MKGYRSFSLAGPNEESPLNAIVDARLHPPKRRKIGLRRYTIDFLIWRPSSFWKDFFPKWMTQNGFNKTSKFSVEAWKLINDGASLEYDNNSKLFHATHDALTKAGKINQTVRIVKHP